ncbi:glycosyltransferase [Demequina mangrovi]|uniref:Glycosyl transferases group 1 n=1 Tax=Demequina mangrovi TaxID=1043493 RepID=A0A1H6Z631_9MICO|nr:glycosyltransferase [Demequina mangrovi]SEJ49013.1 Glycosyl transferases group 1 [Demequina mangrovi]
MTGSNRRALFLALLTVTNIVVVAGSLAILAVTGERYLAALIAVVLGVAGAVSVPPPVIYWERFMAHRAQRVRMRHLQAGISLVFALIGVTGAWIIDGPFAALAIFIAAVGASASVAISWRARRHIVAIPFVRQFAVRVTLPRERQPGTGASKGVLRSPANVTPHASHITARVLTVSAKPGAASAPELQSERGRGTGTRALPIGSDKRRRVAPASSEFRKRIAHLEHAARRGYETAALDALESYASTPGLDSRFRAEARLARVYVLDHVGRQADGDKELLRAAVTDPAVLAGKRAAARWVHGRARSGAVDEALSFIASRQVEHGFEPEVHIALLSADTEALPDDARLDALSRCYLDRGFCGIARIDPGRPATLGNIRGAVSPGASYEDGPLVSVLIPAFNCEDTIGYAIDSVLAQTHRSLEVIVVDDASTDGTRAVVEDRIGRDSRLSLVRLTANGGAYAARNIALAGAAGDLVTVHDADDWAHPQQIATQVARHAEAQGVIATVVERVRVDDALQLRSGFARSSPTFMVARAVFDELGVWQELRINADTEFTDRFARMYGRDAIVTVSGRVPFTLARISGRNLTADGPRGLRYIAHASGARAQHLEASRAWQNSAAFSTGAPTLDPDCDRPFPIPRLMDPALQSQATTRHLDVVLMSDFVLPGGTTSANIREIRAWREAGMTVGLINHPRFPDRVRGPINAKYWDVIDGDQVRLLSVGESITTDLLVFVHPPMAVHLADELPCVEADRAVLVVNQAPRRLYDDSPDDVHYYDLDKVVASLERRFGVEVLVAPLSPSIRGVLREKHADELSGVTMSEEDWLVCLDPEDWARPAPRRRDGAIVVGRHSRDGVEKWPLSAEDLLGAYPEATPFEVRVLGGARVPATRIGHLPANWTVTEFDSVHPRDFLAELDVYVYFTHPTMIEAFGLAPLEALAVGVPLVTSRSFEPIFGDAALYCTPSEVATVVTALMADPARYEDMVERGRRLVRNHYSFARHVARVSRFSGALDVPAGEVLPVPTH